VLTFRAILAWILRETQRRRPLLEIPPAVARLQASLAQRLPGKPFTLDQLTMLSRDNVVGEAAPGLASLGIVATPIDAVVPAYLDRYRAGGGKRILVPQGPLRS